MTRLAAFSALALLAGCAGSITVPGSTPIATTTTTPVAAPPQQTLAQFTDADFATAIAMANASAPPDTEGVACFTYLRAQIALFNGQIGGLIKPDGIVSTFEAAHLGVNLVNGGILSPAQKAAVEQNCGPYFLNVAGGLTTLLAKLGVASGSIAIGLPAPLM